MLNLIISRDRCVFAGRGVAAMRFGAVAFAWSGITTLKCLGVTLAIASGVSSLRLAYRLRRIASAHEQLASAS